MLLLLVPSPAAPTALDAAASLDDCVYRLGLASAADFASVTWISPAELYQFADDAVKRLAAAHGLFVQYDTSVAITSGTASYALPAGHVYTVLAVLIPPTGTVRFLRASTVAELFALDSAWAAASGTPARYSEDAGAIGSVLLYPNPSANATLGIVCQKVPATVAAGASTLALPTVLQDYFSTAMVKAALEKESEASMRDVAEHLGHRLDLYEQVMTHLWGSGA